ncbi:outer membrane lipoprotein DolP-like [Globicephala melas]|uniref:outer membrane lipoprotein DolP-like n=1 Tax=Globicephala melas TaxID=9731 RepID=UPI00293D4AC4|nr:outer membrane lipoprotein DolP-like [Globicephala melas]
MGLVLALGLSGCTTGAIIGTTFGIAGTATAIGTTAVVASDRRPIQIQFKDRQTSNQIQRAVNREFPHSHIDLIVYNQRLLLTGETPGSAERKAIELFVKKNSGEHIKKVINQIAIGDNASSNQNAKDGWITTKVRTHFTTNLKIPENSIQIVTSRNEVYLMGLVTSDEADRAAKVASKVRGVTRVIKVFEEYVPKHKNP